LIFFSHCAFSQDNTAVEIDIPAGETRYLTVQLLVNGSIELSYVITSNGGGVIYISETSENPNSALFEISFRITQVRHFNLFNVDATNGFQNILIFISD